MTAVIFDTETTGTEEPELVQAAYIPVDIAGDAAGRSEVSYWRPSKPISLGALATHHILDEELSEFPPSSDFRLPEGVEYLIGYNVDFDWRVIGFPPLKRIDLCAMCRELWPEADSHSQGAMLYLLERWKARDLLRRAHDAGVDVIISRIILKHVLAKAGPFANFDELWHASERARVPTVMPFGKHKGEPISAVPYDYKRWLLGQPDVDDYLRRALLR